MFSRSSNFKIILIKLGLILLITNVLTDFVEGVNEDKKMRLCGKKLTRALETVCQGIYQQMGKKSSN